MKKLLLLLGASALLAPVFSQNVGIGVIDPQTKLQVEGAISSTPSSLAAAPSVTIPDNVSIFRLTLTAGGGTTALSMANPKEGQYLTIYNQDDNTATFAGNTIAATNGVLSLNYINSAWRLVSDNQKQQLSVSANQISISGGNTVTLTGWDTDASNDVTTSTSAGGDLTGTYPNVTIGNNKVTFGKMQAITANRLLGSGQSGTSVSEIVLGGGLNFTGNTLNTTNNGTVTSVGSGQGLTGGPITGSGSLRLDYSSTLAGNPTLGGSEAVFGDGGIIFEGSQNNSHEGLLTVADPSTDRTWTLPDASGTIMLSGTAAGGDLSGTYTSPTVARINGVALGTTTATSGNILIGNGAQWVTQNVDGDASISSNGALTLANSGVTAGNYGNSGANIPNITVDAKGRITAASNRALTPALVGMTNLTQGTGIATFTYNGGTAATVGLANGTAAGQVFVTGSTPFAPALRTMSGDASIASNGTVTLANSGVTSGSYGNSGANIPNITVDAKGRITAASNRALTPALVGMTNLTQGTGIATFTYNGGTAATVGLANGTAAGQIFVTGTTPFAPSLVAMSGDASIASNGALTIGNNRVTYGKIQAATATSRILGSSSSSTAIQELTIGSGLTLTGTTLSATAASGITGSGSSGYLPKFTSASAVGNSLVYDNGTNVSIGLAGAGNSTLQVNGSIQGKTRIISSNGNVTLDDSDFFVLITASFNSTVNLVLPTPSTVKDGRILIIKHDGGSNAKYNIQSPSGSTSNINFLSYSPYGYTNPLTDDETLTFICGNGKWYQIGGGY